METLPEILLISVGPEENEGVCCLESLDKLNENRPEIIGSINHRYQPYRGHSQPNVPAVTSA